MNTFKIDDLVETLEHSAEVSYNKAPLYRKGDKGIIRHVNDNGTFWVDFSNQSNSVVTDDGLWCVTGNKLKLLDQHCEGTQAWAMQQLLDGKMVEHNNYLGFYWVLKAGCVRKSDGATLTTTGLPPYTDGYSIKPSQNGTPPRMRWIV